MLELSFFDVNCISVQTTCKKYQTCSYIYFTGKRDLFKLLISFYEDPWMGMNLYLYKSTVHVPLIVPTLVITLKTVTQIVVFQIKRPILEGLSFFICSLVLKIENSAPSR